MKHLTYQYIKLQETDSTNQVARQMLRPESSHTLTVISSDYQTAGRGESGGWESERGQNLLFTIVCAPTFLKPRQQFAISELMAVALHDTLLAYQLDEVTIKWPNDVYLGDGKACGMLIEHDIADGQLGKTIIGVGLNVNQTRFLSDAPNPVSMAQKLNRHIDSQKLLKEDLLPRFGSMYLDLEHEVQNKPEWDLALSPLHRKFVQSLYRNDGIAHRFSDQSGEFWATLNGVEADGRLRLTRNGQLHHYAFKEVRFLPDTCPTNSQQ